MTDYCTVDEVRGVLARDGQTPTGTAATLMDVNLLEYHIRSAEAEVDARLAGRYRVPFLPGAIPALVRALTVDVAAYLATLTYRQSKDLGVDDPVRLRYQRALDMLKELADGSMDLPPSDTEADEPPASAGAASVRNPYEGRMFTPGGFGLGYERGCRGW